MNIAVVLSGGIGTRLGGQIPKQYLRVDNKTILSYSLKIFEECDEIDVIQIVAEDIWQDVILENKMKKFRGFSKPGVNRQLSIFSALADLRSFASEEDIVIVHDAARPCVTVDMIKSLIRAAKEHEGALPVLPMKDTVYMSEDSKQITSLLNRGQIFAGQAPEAFKYEKYYKANERLLPKDILNINGSTEPAVMAGMDIAMIPGDERNFKITTIQDLERFQRLREI